MGNPLAPQQVSVPSSSATNQTQMYSPNPQAAADINNVLGRAQGVANLPYVPYAGELGAPVNQQQNLGISGVNQYAGWGQPYLQAAGAAATQGATPITSNDIQNWMNPYTKNVTDALGQQFALQNAQGLNQLQGNAASQHALGGDRVGLAQAQYLSNQQVNQSPIMANVLMQNYQQAVAAAQAAKNQQFQGAYSLGNVGTAGQNLALQGAGAQIGAGTLEQNTQQLLDQLNLQQFNQGQAFPYQQTSWLAGLTGGLAPALGGTTTGTGSTQGFQTQLGPSWGSQAAGLAMAGIGGYGMYQNMNKAFGGRAGYDVGGAPGVPGAPYGGVGGPYGGVAGFIPQAPQMNIQRPPPAQLSLTPNVPSQPQSMAGTGNEIADNAMRIAQLFKRQQKSYGEAAPLGGASPDDDGEARGGFIRGFAPGGDVAGDRYTFDDRFSGGDTFDDRFSPATAGVSGSLVPDNYDIYSPKQDRWEAAPDDYLRPGPAAPRRTSIASGEAAPLGLASPQRTALGSWYSQLPEAGWRDYGDRPNSNALGVPDREQGIALPSKKTLGQWFDVTDPQGGVHRLQQTDVGPAPWTGRGIDISAAAADKMGYKPGNFPTDAAFAFSPVSGSEEVPLSAKYADTPFAGDADGEAGGVNASAYAPTGRREITRDRHGDKIEKPDPWMALMAAGFGTMAGTSPWGLSNIGHGGLQGLQQYAGDVQRINQNRRIDLEAQRLQNQVEQHRETLAQQKALHDVPSGYRKGDNGLEIVPGGPADPEVLAKQAKAKLATTLSDRALDIGARQMADGDLTPLTNVGRGAQGGATIAELRNRMYDVLINERGMNPEQAASFVSMQTQAFKARQLALNADARTTATREANLNMIIKVADSAVPAALEQSDIVYRTQFVPLNKIIQGGRIMTSDPEQKKFGVANIQLAEGWARAMNPTGQMREFDRDIALSFLSTADSKEAYRAAVLQVQKQIHRERDAISSTTPGGWQPGATAAPATPSVAPATVPPPPPGFNIVPPRQQ